MMPMGAAGAGNNNDGESKNSDWLREDDEANVWGVVENDHDEDPYR